MARGGKQRLPGTPAGFGSQAIQTARSGEYGSQAASAASQRAVPVANMAQAPGVPSPGAPSPASSMVPGSVPLDMASMRPNEPITEGASFGPGKSLRDLNLPEPQMPAEQQAQIDPKMFSVYLPMLEAVTSIPGSSVELRSFTRRLRAQMPLGFDPTAGM